MPDVAAGRAKCQLGVTLRRVLSAFLPWIVGSEHRRGRGRQRRLVHQPAHGEVGQQQAVRLVIQRRARSSVVAETGLRRAAPSPAGECE